MNKSNCGIRACCVLLVCVGAAFALQAQTTAISSGPPTFTPLQSFDYTNGAYPQAGLVQGVGGSLYGTTFGGGCGESGEEGCGTVFGISPAGKLTVLYVFCSQGGNECTDGLFPEAGLVQGLDGKFYGTTSNGGAGYGNDYGTVFSITASGDLTTLYSFCSQGGQQCTDGATPHAGLVRGADGNFYGTTGGGGDNVYDAGTVFRMTPAGKLTTLYSFCSQGGPDCTDGLYPLAGLVQGTDAKFYGTTARGGASTGGTVFSITAAGELTTLYSFENTCTDGCYPVAALVQGTDGNFYGTTSTGGPPPGGDGTVFSITPSGILTTLHSFEGVDYGDGSYPVAGLVQGTEGNFYGTTEYGGNNNGQCGPGCGTVFQLTPQGNLTTLHDFCSQGGNGCTDGLEPMAGLVQDTDGTFYGTTAAGGADYLGVVYSLSMGLSPFVETNPAAARVGKKVGILGTNFTGATGVTFNGTSAAFNVHSPTLIIATVPSGATTGTVQVQLPGGTLSSNVPFIVLPLH